MSRPVEPAGWDGVELRFDHLTAPEIGQALAAGYTTVVLACGATEQHGPHLTLSMDASHGTALSAAVARKLGRALAAPTLRVGCSDHHMGFAGTLTLRAETFRAVLIDHVRSLVHHGFRRIVVIPTHGGNFAPLTDALPQLAEEAGPEVEVWAFTDLGEVMAVWTRIADESGLGDGVGGHADVAEGSIMMALHPDRVRIGRCEPGLVGPLTRRLFEEGMAAVSPNGILGDPRGMNARLGRRLVDGLADRIVELISGR